MSNVGDERTRPNILKRRPILTSSPVVPKKTSIDEHLADFSLDEQNAAQPSSWPATETLFHYQPEDYMNTEAAQPLRPAEYTFDERTLHSSEVSNAAQPLWPAIEPRKRFVDNALLKEPEYSHRAALFPVKVVTSRYNQGLSNTSDSTIFALRQRNLYLEEDNRVKALQLSELHNVLKSSDQTIEELRRQLQQANDICQSYSRQTVAFLNEFINFETEVNQLVNDNKDLLKRSEKFGNCKRALDRAKARKIFLKKEIDSLSKKVAPENNQIVAVSSPKPYSSDLHKQTKQGRFGEVLNFINDRVNGGDKDAFIRDFVNHADVQSCLVDRVHKVDPLEALILMRTIGISWGKMATLKASLKRLSGIDVLPSFRQLRTVFVENSKKIFYESFFVDHPQTGDKIAVLQCVDVGEMVKMRVQAMWNQSTFSRDDNFHGKLWLTISADKGGGMTRLCLAIGNSLSPNSPHSLILCGFYQGNDSGLLMSTCLSKAIDQINNLSVISITDKDNTQLDLEVLKFHTGDFMYLYSSYGHKGPNTPCFCLFCREKVSKILSPVFPATSEKRTLASIERDHSTGSHGMHKNGTTLFEIEPDHVIPPSLHTLMGLAEVAFRALEGLAVSIDNSGVPQNLSDQKKLLKTWKDELRELEKVSNNLKDSLTGFDVAENAMTSILEKRIDSSRGQKVCDLQSSCLYRCKIAQKVKPELLLCSICGGDFHSLCSGIIAPILLKKNQQSGLVCFDCEGKTLADRIRIFKHEKEQTLILASENQVERQVLREKIDSLVSSLEKKQGPMSRLLDQTYKECGADPSAYFQRFCGNHVVKLLTPEKIQKLWSIFPVTPQTISFEKYMGHLSDLCKYSRARFLTREEITKFPILIENLRNSLFDADPLISVTPKIHAVFTHVQPFIETFGTWGLTSEQSIESFHALMNNLERTYAPIRCDLTRFIAMADHVCFLNMITDRQ